MNSRLPFLLLAALPMLAACGGAAGQDRAVQGQAQRPSDIHPVTLSRLPPPTPEDLDEEGRQLLAARPNFRAGPGPGQFSGYNPDSRDLGIPDGEGSPVGARYFQLATIITAREIDQEYEWASHAVRGLVQGLDQAVIDVVKNDRDVTGLSDKDATLITFGRTLLRENGVSSELWERMVGHFGRQQTVQLLQIMAAYLRVGIMLNAVDQQNPELDDAWWTARGCVAECKQAAMAAQVELLSPDQAQAQRPSDIHPVTLSRLPPATPEDLDEEGRRLLAARPNRTAGPGPGQFQAYNPDSRDLGIPDGEGSPVGARYFQLATMITAREIDQEYEWSSHAVRGFVQGVEQAVIDVVQHDRAVTGLSDKDATLITFGRTLLRENGVSSELWERMVGHFGRQQTVQLLQIMAAYLRVGIMLNAVDQQNPELDDAWWTARGCVAECKQTAMAARLEILPPLER